MKYSPLRDNRSRPVASVPCGPMFARCFLRCAQHVHNTPIHGENLDRDAPVLCQVADERRLLSGGRRDHVAEYLRPAPLASGIFDSERLRSWRPRVVHVCHPHAVQHIQPVLHSEDELRCSAGSNIGVGGRYAAPATLRGDRMLIDLGRASGALLALEVQGTRSRDGGRRRMRLVVVRPVVEGRRRGRLRFLCLLSVGCSRGRRNCRCLSRRSGAAQWGFGTSTAIIGFGRPTKDQLLVTEQAARAD